MLVTDSGWQDFVNGELVISCNNWVESGRVKKDLRCMELNLGVHRRERVVVSIEALFLFFMVLRHY